jgi:hypothetical protein
MTAYNGVNMALVADNGLADKGDVNANVKHLRDSYAFLADVFALDDTIKIGTLPNGAKVVGAGIRIPVSLGTTGIFDLGTTDDVDGFVDGCDAGGQAAVKLASTEAMLGKKFNSSSDAMDVYLRCAEATDASSGDLIYAWVEYVLE